MTAIAVPQPSPPRQEFPLTELSQTLSQFADHLLVMKGLRPSTIEGCLRVIKKVLRDLGTLHLTQPEVMQYVVELHKAGYSHSHIANNCLAIERYSEFQGAPIKLGRPKKPKWRIKSSSVLSEAKIAVLLHAAESSREMAILAILAYSGMRNQELCNLRVRDVEMGNNILHVNHGKGDKYRPVCIAGECTETLQQYLKDFPRPDDKFLFTALRSGRKLSTWTVRMICKKVARRTKIDPMRVRPHNFRHSLVDNWLSRGADILAVQGQLGHSHISTTMIYVAPSFKRQQAEYNLRAPSYI